MSLPIHAERIEEVRPLLTLLPDLPDDERFAFIRYGEGIVAWGVAARIPVGTGPDRFTCARDGLTALLGTTGGGDPTAAPVAFASFAFDADEDASVMVVPRIAIRRQGGATWRITVGGLEGGPDLTMPAERRAASVDRPRYGGSTVRDDLWLEAVAQTVTAIEEGAYEKLVLARDLHLWSRVEFDILAILDALAARFPSCFTFFVNHLVGASPELLLRRVGPRVESRVLAGTAGRGADEKEDGALGEALLSSAKDRHEHGLALDSAIDALDPICASLHAPAVPSLVRLENVQHLASDLSGRLAPDAVGALPHVLDVLARLHPTAAVGGVPREKAASAIREREGMSRGRYAGPIGWCSADGDGEFAIALRCAEVQGDRARLFAGAGIVLESLPEQELAETWLKFRAMIQVLDTSEPRQAPDS